MGEIIDTGLGWKADEDYLIYDNNVLIDKLYGREFKTVGDGWRIAVHAMGYNDGSGPFLVSSVRENCQTSQGSLHIGGSLNKFDIDWYISANDWWFGGYRASVDGVAPSIDFRSTPANYEAAIDKILTESRVTPPPPPPTPTGGFYFQLMVNNSEKNKIRKTLLIVAEIGGVLKENSSIINPVIMIDYDLSALPNVNYLYIPIWNRYYFINDIISIRSALCELHCHVDVLESFKNEILANEAIIYRQENYWNLYINDDLFHTYQNKNIEVKEFPYGFTEPHRVLVLAGSLPNI